MAHQKWLADALQAAGLDVIAYVGWETRGSTTFDPRGLVLHHTGPWSSVAGMVQLCINGRSDLPGPLCQIVLDPEGVCHVIAAGRANHAGPGGWKGLSGNSSVLGIEAIHNGSAGTPWPAVQITAYKVAAAALACHAGFTPSMVCGHREWAPTRKVDPTGINLDAFRSEVTRLLASPKGAAPMYDPPLGPIAAVWQREGTGDVVAAVTPDGHVYAWGVSFAGNPAGRTWWGPRRAALIGPRPDGAPGYRITATSGETYDLPTDAP